MAYVPTNPNDLTDEEKKKQQESSGGMPGGDIGSSGSGAQGAPSAAGTGFTNLRTYLDANKDQAAGLAGKIAGKLGSESETFKTDVGNAANAFQESVKSGSIVPDEGLVGRAASNPVEFVKNPQDVERFKTMRDATYKGPNAFEEQQGFGDLSARLAGLEQQSKLVDTEEGRLALLEQLSPDMGKGKLNFNNLLLSGEPTSRETLSEAVSPYANLRAFLDEQTKNLNTSAGKSKSDTETARKEVEDSFTGPQGALTSLENDITGRVQSKEMERQKINSAISHLRDVVEGRVDPSALTPEEEAIFGIPVMPAGSSSPGAVGWLRENNIAAANPKWMETYFPGTVAQPIDPNPTNVMTQDENARLAALLSLMGLESPFYVDPSFLGTYTDPKVGLYHQPTIAVPGLPKNPKGGNRLPGQPGMV